MQQDLATLMNNNTADKIEISIKIDSELLKQLEHLTNDPSKIIEMALKQWLRGEREREDDLDLTRSFRRNPPLPPKGEWND